MKKRYESIKKRYQEMREAWRDVCFLCLESFHVGKNEILTRHEFVSKVGEIKELRICGACWNSTLRSWVEKGHSSVPTTQEHSTRWLTQRHKA